MLSIMWYNSRQILLYESPPIIVDISCADYYPNVTEMWKKWENLILQTWVKYVFHYTDIHETQEYLTAVLENL
jgi:hypothetical protein